MSIPDLTFPGVPCGQHETPWDMKIFLYRGAANLRKRDAANSVSGGDLGTAITGRVSLIVKLHAILLSDVVGGGAKRTLNAVLGIARQFYRYADETGLDPTEANAKAIFASWCEQVELRQRLKQIKALTAYTQCVRFGTLLAEALDLKSSSLLRAARLTKPKGSKRVLGTQADKQNLAATFAFGHSLLDVTESLTAAAIRGPLPVPIHLRSGEILQLWCRLQAPERLKALDPGTYESQRRRTETVRQKWSDDASTRTRYPLINLRIECEILILIAQTGMNLAQAWTLRMGNFRYESHHSGYAVRRIYKGRRRGEVEFEIFSAYRPIFERYLQWRAELFPDSKDGLLFPFVTQTGKSTRQERHFWATKKIMRQLGMAFIGPRKLRNTRINWLLRNSDNPELTAEQAQHSKETLLRVYQQPHHQRACVEVTRFWQQSDPSVVPPGPGACVKALPVPLPDTPFAAPQPDCVGPAGCLFCVHQRDVDSSDHIWSLTSYRHLKSLEMARTRPHRGGSDAIPAALVIQRITDKLKALGATTKVRAQWVRDAQARVDEGDYHPLWDGFLQLAEAWA